MSKTGPNFRATHSGIFSEAASVVAHYAGHPVAFATAFGIVVVWMVSGPFFQFSDTWQLVINTGTTIVTFLMVFLIQNSQNRDGVAIQAKLDELLRASSGEDIFIGIEHLDEEEIELLRKKVEAAAQARRKAGRRVKKPRKSSEAA